MFTSVPRSVGSITTKQAQLMQVNAGNLQFLFYHTNLCTIYFDASIVFVMCAMLQLVEINPFPVGHRLGSQESNFPTVTF